MKQDLMYIILNMSLFYKTLNSKVFKFMPRSKIMFQFSINSVIDEIVLPLLIHCVKCKEKVPDVEKKVKSIHY